MPRIGPGGKVPDAICVQPGMVPGPMSTQHCHHVQPHTDEPERFAGRARRRFRGVSTLLAAWLATGMALAQDESMPSSGGLDRILFVLGILLVLAQATERLMVLLKKVLAGCGCRWAERRSRDSLRLSAQDAKRASLLNAYSVFVGLLTAFICGIDILDVASTGVVSSLWADGVVWMGSLPHWIGVLIAGLIASMGSAFLHDLINIVAAVKEARRNVASTAGMAEALAAPIGEPEEDIRALLDNDVESIYDIDRASLGLSLNELAARAPVASAELREQGVEGIIAVGPSYKERGGRLTRIRGLTVSVVEKQADPEWPIQPFFETVHVGEKILVPLDVREVGEPCPTAGIHPGETIEGETGWGTACCIVEDAANGAKLLLGCRHVLGDENAEPRWAGRPIGKVDRSWPPLDASAATIDLDPGELSNQPPHGEPPAGTLGLMRHEVSNLSPRLVWAFGAEDRRLVGNIIEVQYEVPVRGIPSLERAFLTRLLVQRGDSGALAVAFDRGRPKAVGMLCAASTEFAWFVPLTTVLRRLGVKLTNQTD